MIMKASIQTIILFKSFMFMFGYLSNYAIDMIPHHIQFILFVVSHYFLNNILHGIDKVLERHLICVHFSSHNFNKNEMIVLFGYLLAGHTCIFRQFNKLTWCKYPLRPYAALTMEYFEHVFNHVHLLNILRFNVQYLFPRIVIISNFHLFLLIQRSSHQK